jgi:hypothetical protein
MRNVSFKIFGIFLIIILFSTQKIIGQVDLSGHWLANCIIEKSDKASIAFCDFCPYSVTENNTSINFKVFEMDFEEDYFNLIIDSVLTKVDYKIEEDIETIEFVFKEKTYRFKILIVFKSSYSNYILKDSDGMLILLEKKNDVLK